MSKEPRYKAQEIELKSLGGKSSQHWNIIDTKTGEKVCTCYGSDKVQIVLLALEIKNDINP